MAKDATKTEGQTKVKKERRVLSPAERLEAKRKELEDLEAKVKEREEREVTKLKERRTTLVGRRDKLNEDIKSLDEQIAELTGEGTEAPATTDTDEVTES